MGEMADMLMDQIMCDDLYYDNVMYEEESDSYIGSGHRQRKPLYCRFCGQGPLLWDRTSNRWIMCENDGSIHDCPNYKLPIDVLKEFALKKKKDYQSFPKPSWDERLSIEEYGCMLSLIGKGRSEDYFTRTSGVAISKDKRILGISYNGLGEGMIVPEWMKKEKNRVKKSEYYLHAEDNLFSLIKKGECYLLCLNISPCISCCRTIAANKVSRVVYLKEYHRCNKFKDFFNFYNIDCVELSPVGKLNIKKYLSNMINFKELEND